MTKREFVTEQAKLNQAKIMPDRIRKDPNDRSENTRMSKVCVNMAEALFDELEARTYPGEKKHRDPDVPTRRDSEPPKPKPKR